MTDLERQAYLLWKLLDDIDTLDDACKDNDDLFRRSAYDVQQKRFDIMSGEEWDVLRSKVAP